MQVQQKENGLAQAILKASWRREMFELTLETPSPILEDGNLTFLLCLFFFSLNVEWILSCLFITGPGEGV